MSDDIKTAAKLLGSRGGKARAEALPESARVTIARKAGKARARKLTAAERAEIARKAAIARWNRKK